MPFKASTDSGTDRNPRCGPVKTSVASHSRPPHEPSGSALYRRIWGQRRLFSTAQRLLGLWYLLRDALHILVSSFRSFRGHISLQSPREAYGPSLGKAFVRGEDQSLQRNPRTLARSFYIEMLWASMPWIDMVDLRIFLMGFDAGEEWSHHTCSGKAANSQAEDSWLNLASQRFGYVPDRVRQAINTDNGQTSDVTPAAIAGVIRND